MLTLPDTIISLLTPFSTLFQRRTWLKSQLLLVVAILSPGKRTVTSALRVMGLEDDRNFARYHHVLSRAVWQPLQLGRTLLWLLLQHLDQGDCPLEPILINLWAMAFHSCDRGHNLIIRIGF